MRSFITTVTFVFASTTLIACDGGESTTPGITAGAAKTEAQAEDVCDNEDPMAMATCHAAYNEAMGRIETARFEASVCKVDADCTITVSETRCTGEIVSAVNSASENAFLGFIDRVDARLCSDVSAVCSTGGDDEPAEVGTRCVENRCAIAE